MATVKGTTMWWQANGSPPKDYGKWAGLVRAFTEHCVARYGADEVEKWYFEVWNEPNLDGFFKNGTQQQYFELYKITALMIKRIDPKLRVGGPTTSNFDLDERALKAALASGKPYDPFKLPWRPIWIEDFLAYCKANNLPVDFISTHPYPQDFTIDDPNCPTTTTFGGVSIQPAMICACSVRLWMPVPILMQRSNSLSGVRVHRRSTTRTIRLPRVPSSSKPILTRSDWSTRSPIGFFTDVFEENRKTDSIFHGCFGLINYQEIVKPAFHAYRFLNELGDELLERTDGEIITREKSSGKVTALAYNYPPEERIALPLTGTLEQADALDASGSARELNLRLRGLPPGTPFMIETLDQQHGDPIPAWESMGKPEPPNREQTRLLRETAWATQREVIRADNAGVLDLHRTIATWSLVLIKQF